MDEAAGRIVKMEVDYSNTVDEMLPQCQQLAKVSPHSSTVSKRNETNSVHL